MKTKVSKNYRRQKARKKEKAWNLKNRKKLDPIPIQERRLERQPNDWRDW